MLSIAGMAQNARIVKGLVIDEEELPVEGVLIEAVGSDKTTMSDANGQFRLEVTPFTKFIMASMEGYMAVRVELDGSYVSVRLRIDKGYMKAKAKAEEEARLAAEREAEEIARAEEEARLIAEREAEERAKAEEEARIAAEKEREKAAEAARLAAEKEKKARMKAAEAERLAAEKEERARAKAAEAERLAAEKAEKARAKAAEIKRRAAEREVRVQAKAERAEELRAIYSEHQSGYASIVDLVFTGGFQSAPNYNAGVNYIGGYRFNNNIFLGAGVGVRIPFDFKYNATLLPVSGELLPNKGLCVPLFAHVRANFLNRRCSPFFALSAGVRFSTPQTLQLELLETRYNNSTAAFVNPQIGVDFRATTGTSVYFSVGYSGYTNTKCIESTGYNAVLKQTICSEFDIHLGVTF